MQNSIPTTVEQRLLDGAQPIIEGLGYSIVELKSVTIRNRMIVSLVLYSSTGLNIESCAEVHRIVAPRLEAIEGRRDIALTVSSPGVSRMLRHDHEYALFIGQRIRLLIDGEHEWHKGRIIAVDDDTITLETHDGHQPFARAQIRKAQLQME